MTEARRTGHAAGMTSRSAFFASCLLGLASGLLGCQRVHVGSNDGGLDASASDGGSAREQCGPVLCGAGEVCCNSSCGICTEPGGACIEIACTNECSSNADCAPTDYCAVPGCGEGMVTGTCIPRPEDCATIAAPIMK